MLAEGMLHTHNAKRYMGRLSIVLGVMIVAESIFIYGLEMEGIAGNPFIDLVLCGLVLMFLKNLEEPGKKKLYALLALLPIAYLGISLGANLFEVSNKGLIDVSWFPKFIRADYNIFGLFLARPVHIRIEDQTQVRAGNQSLHGRRLHNFFIFWIGDVVLKHSVRIQIPASAHWISIPCPMSPTV